MIETPMTCDRLDALLSEYLEGALAEGDRAAIERHARSCTRCGALVADLTSIARDARALPDLIPSRDLWAGVAARIDAPVVELPRGAGRGARGVEPRWRRLSLAAAAALLVAASSGITYLAMRPHAQGTVGTYASAQDTATARSESPSPAESTHASADSNVGPRPAPRAPLAAGAPRSELVSRPAAEHVYDREIARLEAIVHDRRSQLDTATIAVIERNLRIIDLAIAQSRDALARDPRSRFLNEQLNTALDQKVELLRTVALLHPRT